MPQTRQPFLHDLVSILAAPTQVWSGGDGQVLASELAAHGVLHGDVRVLSRILVQLDGDPGEHIATRVEGPTATFSTVFRGVGSDPAGSPDPQVRLDRTRTVEPGRVVERLTLDSRLTTSVDVEVAVVFATDFASVEVIKMGRPSALRLFAADPDGDRASWADGELTVRLSCPGAELTLTPDRRQLTARWRAVAPARGQVDLEWRLSVEAASALFVAPRHPALSDRWPEPADAELGPWLAQSRADLNSLALASRAHPDDVFLAAGAPWYLTLFGRDSIWAARLLLPLDLSLARGTLRTLARLQGSTVDAQTAEEPGKIPHEQRRAPFELEHMSLPALYYGTIDATPLWVCLLHDAWRAGLPEADIEPLLPHLERALAWLVTYGDADGDGFLEYLDATGHGLANQGWKDSADAVRFADGTIAEGPVALCEVQGYAYEAAISGAELLDAFARPGGDRYREWAAALADRFRGAFWCGTGEERFPALALDGAKRRVDSLTSNIGHLLGTGLLNAEEERLVAIRVSSEALDSGLGLRTMSAHNAGYAPLSYHCGSVWPHDTAIVIDGLLRAGLGQYATGLAAGLGRASVAFGGRLPELFSGEGRPVPYPAACRPQAWSAAAAMVVARVGAGGGPGSDPHRAG